MSDRRRHDDHSAMANILIVDDDEQACTVVASLFGHAGHKICVAYNGQSAIDKIAVDRPGVVLLDLLMPVMDGWQVLEMDPRTSHHRRLADQRLQRYLGGEDARPVRELARMTAG